MTNHIIIIGGYVQSTIFTHPTTDIAPGYIPT